jgi:uncharacterized membrane protein
MTSTTTANCKLMESTPNFRFWELDFIRGLAEVMMVFYYYYMT